MPRRAAQVTQADIARTLRAYRDAKLPQPRIVVRPDGVIFEPMPEQVERRQEPVADDERVVVL